MFLIIYGINRGSLGDDEAKKFATKQILEIYKFHHNNNLPNDMKEDD